MNVDLPIYVVDAFSQEAFGGNPAAVCLLTSDISDSSKQSIAAEMNLSETAFVLDLSSEGNDESVFQSKSRFELRWFTPTTEVPICGHATLASAAVLFSERKNRNETIEFITRKKGVLTVGQSGTDLSLRIPLDPATEVITPTGRPDIWRIVEAVMGGNAAQVLEVQACIAAAPHYLLIRLRDELGRTGLEAVAVPPSDKLVALDTVVQGVIITVKGGSKHDFYSRFFGHWVGVPEDPVTGSSFAVLGPFWSEVLGGKREMVARQCSKRGGVVRMRIEDQGWIQLFGQAKIVLKGKLTL